jgi:hypothetical protein
VTVSGAAARALTPEERLHAHLRTHLDADYAAFLLQEILAAYSDFKPRGKGDPIPTMWDDDIARLDAAIDGHHTGGKRLADYWCTIYKSASLCRLRKEQRKRGRPENEDRAWVIYFLNQYYPLDLPRKTCGCPFQETVRQVCTFAGIGVPVDNLKKEYFQGMHDVIIKALAGPSAPSRWALEEVRTDFELWKTKHLTK